VTDEELIDLFTDLVRSAPPSAYLEVGAEVMARIHALIPEHGPRPWQVGMPDPYGIPIVSSGEILGTDEADRLPPNGWRLAHRAPTMIREGLL